MKPIGPYSRPRALADMDGRTKEARLARSTRAGLVAHVGGAPSVTQWAVIERCVQLSVRIATLDRKFTQTGEMTELDSRTYLAWSGHYCRAMALLGLTSAPEKPTNILDHIATLKVGRAAQA